MNIFDGARDETILSRINEGSCFG